jgi:hypothetical protein
VPLPHTRVIHKDFSTHHRPTAEGGMTAKGTLRAPDSAASAVFDEALGYSTYPDVTPGREWALRVQRANAAAEPHPGAERSTVDREYLVALPVEAPEVAVFWLITITECDDDPALVDRVLRVKEVRYESPRWQRNLICLEHTNVSR